MKNINKYILAAGLLIGASACTLDVEPQQNVEVADKGNIAEEELVNGLYSTIMSDVSYYGRNLYLWGDIGTDIVVQNRNSGRFFEVYRLMKEATTSESDIYDKNTYDQIFEVVANANLIIGDENITGNTRGQALFVRAFAYLDLVRVFGAVPIVDQAPTSVEEALQLKPSKNTREEVFQLIFGDLTEAQALITNTDSKWATVNAVHATFSRAYMFYAELHQTDAVARDAAFQNAIDHADMVSGVSLVAAEKYAEYFRTTGGEETILEFVVTADQSRGSNNFGNIYLDPAVGGYGDYTANPDFITSMNRVEDGDAFDDVRGVTNYDGALSPSVIYSDSTTGTPGVLYNHKYFESDKTLGLHSPKVLRYAEVLLNKAEAMAHLGDLAGAATVLNELRANRYVAPVQLVGESNADFQLRVDAYNAALSITTADLDAVLEERKAELAFEGHRMFDLRRNNRVVTSYSLADGGETMATEEEATFDPATFSGAHQQWFPIPERELLANENMTQNNGY